MDKDAPPLPRPRWLVVLSTLMFLWAAMSFEDGIRGLVRGPDLGVDERSPAPPGLTAPERIQRQLSLGLAAIERAHPRALTAVAVADLVRALVLLFAVAAIATNDPRGRQAGRPAWRRGWSGSPRSSSISGRSSPCCAGPTSGTSCR